MREPLLVARAVEWRARGRVVVDGVDLDVARGECLAIVGPNGAGKTTLLKLLAGLETPSGGQILLGNEPLDSLARRRIARRLAYVPQLRPDRIPLTVAQMVMLGRYPHWRRQQLAPSVADFDAVTRALATVGLEALAERRMDRLSGGELQRVFVAACLAQEAEILILDEPTTHLDPRHQRDVARLVLDLRRAGAHAIVCATHDLNFASLIADRIVGLRGGCAEVEGEPADVLAPAQLERLFGARFETVVDGERPVTVLRLEAP